MTVNPRHYFEVYDVQDLLFIRTNSYINFSYIKVFIDDQELSFRRQKNEVVIPKKSLTGGTHLLNIKGKCIFHSQEHIVEEGYSFTVDKERENTQERQHDFKCGDIIVASDNKKGIPDGYMGHSALVIDDSRILESNNRVESISITPISHFYDDHQWYALFRPKNDKLGYEAVKWGLSYHKKYKEKLEKGVNRPKFSFLPSKDLKDLWTTIYCSKLIWLCYFFGANHPFKQQGLWFSPQNLNDELKNDDQFKLIYKHPKHSFKIKL
ncbi:hypothetical protein QA612_13200 [Evansella sp. AB-P1]|uniref:hypothetical protein n=1 Tax=Evansella sp. AB-P1 TaxID=3037653 RepID=UPI00241D73D7|nr:hypothetical protein [Evansella sp. AB-P1]MDG5788439.1 hypothetical protein [Evansella sp. AB-P1]